MIECDYCGMTEEELGMEMEDCEYCQSTQCSSCEDACGCLELEEDYAA
jgi:hypothetical protein